MSWFTEQRTSPRRPQNTGVSGYGPGGTPPPPVEQGAPTSTATAPVEPTGSSLAQRYPSIVDAYKKYLGRVPSDAEIRGQTGNGTFGANDPRLTQSVRNIQTSPEAKAYKPAAETPVTPGRTAENNPGLDPAKWIAGHTSPKYAFHEVAKKYDQRTDAGRAQTLKELQTLHPQWFNGWTIAGDKLRFGGDPKTLDGKWDGYNEFDAWRGSKAGEWAPQWIPTQRNGQAYVSPEQQAASAQSATQAASGGALTGPVSTSVTPAAQNAQPVGSNSPMNMPPQQGQNFGNGGYGVDSGQGFGALMAPWEYEFAFPYFEAPQGEEVFEDPGYQFRRDEGEKAIQRSAAARGTVLNPGTVKALQDFNSGLASQEYANAYGREFNEFSDARNQAFNEYNTAYQVFNRNQETPFNRLAAIADLGQTSAGNLGSLGASYAGNYGNTLMQGANTQGDYLTQGANAQAAGRVGGANAWNNALGNIGNNIGQSYYNSQYMRPRTPGSPFNFGTPVNVNGLG